MVTGTVVEASAVVPVSLKVVGLNAVASVTGGLTVVAISWRVVTIRVDSLGMTAVVLITSLPVVVGGIEAVVSTDICGVVGVAPFVVVVSVSTVDVVVRSGMLILRVTSKVMVPSCSVTVVDCGIEVVVSTDICCVRVVEATLVVLVVSVGYTLGTVGAVVTSGASLDETSKVVVSSCPVTVVSSWDVSTVMAVVVRWSGGVVGGVLTGSMWRVILIVFKCHMVPTYCGVEVKDT